MTAQTWRVVLESGEVKSAEVRARRWADGLWWHLASPYDGGACKTPRAAVAQLAAYAGFGSEVIEIRAPGELTTAEAVAAAVAVETARCVAVCEDRAGMLHIAADHRGAGTVARVRLRGWHGDAVPGQPALRHLGFGGLRNV